MTINYGKVIGRFLGVIEDGIDADDEPDFSPLSGTVTFTPAVTKVLAVGENPPVSIFPQTIKASLDSNGYLTHNFKKGVKLLSPSGGVNPSGWTWNVSFDLKQGTKTVSATSFDIEIPVYEPGPDTQNPDVGSTAVDLAVVAPVSSSGGTPIIRGEQGDSVESIALSPDESALVFTVGGVESQVPFPSTTAPTWNNIQGKPEIYTETEVDTLLDSKSDVIYEVDLRTPSTSPTDYKDVEIQQAFSGVKARIGPGDWHISGPISVVPGASVTLAGANIISHYTGTEAIFKQSGSISGSPRAITAGGTKDSLSITTDTTGLAVGDWVYIISDATAENYPSIKASMLRQIVAIGTGTLSIDIPLHTSLTTNANCIKVNFAQGLRLMGTGSISHIDPESRQGPRPLLKTVLCQNVYLDDGILFKDNGAPGWQVEHCVNSESRASYMDLIDDAANNHYGYGINIGGASRNIVGRGSARRVRHGMTTGYSGEVLHASLPSIAGEPEDSIMDMYVREGINAGVDTHEPGRRTVMFVNTEDCSIGFQDRAIDTIVYVRRIVRPNLYGGHIADTSIRAKIYDFSVIDPSPSPIAGASLLRLKSHTTIVGPRVEALPSGWTAINSTGAGTVDVTILGGAYLAGTSNESGSRKIMSFDGRTILTAQNTTVDLAQLMKDLGLASAGATINATASGTMQGRFLRAVGTGTGDVPFRSDGASGATGNLAEFRVNGVTRQLFAANGDIEIVTTGRGMIMKSPNGTRYKITVGDDGAISATAV